MTKLIRLAVTALAVGIIAFPAMAEDKDPVAAKVNGAEIRRSEVVREMQSMGAQAAQVPPNVLYPQLLQKMIITKLVAKLGYDAKVQNEKEVKDRLKSAEEQIVADVYVRNTVQPKITEDKLKARYNELAAKFKPEEEVRARHILVQTEDEAKDLLKQIKGGADFAKLATDKSKDTGSAKQGGDLGYFTKSVMVKPFADAAFSMKAGEISDKPIKTDFGYHVLKVEDRRKTSAPPMEEVKDQLMNQVGQELVQEMIKNIEGKAKIERFNPDGSPMKASEAAPAKK